jgi:hypothetical protein
MAASGVSKCGGRSVTEVSGAVVADALADDEARFTVVEVADDPTAAVDDRPAPHALTTETKARNKASEADRFIR